MTVDAKTAGPEERIPFRLIRRRTAEKMLESVQKIPHVSHFEEADVTDLVALRAQLKPEAEKRGIKLSYLPFICKALIATLKECPSLNAVLDEKNQEQIKSQNEKIKSLEKSVQFLENTLKTQEKELVQSMLDYFKDLEKKLEDPKFIEKL